MIRDVNCFNLLKLVRITFFASRCAFNEKVLKIRKLPTLFQRETEKGDGRGDRWRCGKSRDDGGLGPRVADPKQLGRRQWRRTFFI